MERSNLYSIQFVYSGDELDYRANTWADGGRRTALFSSFDVPNRSLAIYHFATRDVSRLDGTTVTFQTNASMPLYAGRWDATVMGATYTDAAGRHYRVPTLNEMKLIVPETTTGRYVFSAPELDPELGDPIVTESVNVSEPLAELFGVPGSGGNGTSDFWRVPVNGSRTDAIVYAIRFKNTEQSSAYRYHFENGAWTIRVKALGLMSLPTKDEVCDEAYWQDGYLPFTFAATNNNRYWTATEHATSTNSAYYLYPFEVRMEIATLDKSGNCSLRLVRVD
jgi:hypothetical protein